MQNNVWKDLKIYCMKHGDDGKEMSIEQHRGVLKYVCSCEKCDTAISTFDVQNIIEKLIKERNETEIMGNSICMKGKKIVNRANTLTVLADKNGCFEIGVS